MTSCTTQNLSHTKMISQSHSKECHHKLCNIFQSVYNITACTTLESTEVSLPSLRCHYLVWGVATKFEVSVSLPCLRCHCIGWGVTALEFLPNICLVVLISVVARLDTARHGVICACTQLDTHKDTSAHYSVCPLSTTPCDSVSSVWPWQCLKTHHLCVWLSPQPVVFPSLQTHTHCDTVHRHTVHCTHCTGVRNSSHSCSIGALNMFIWLFENVT